MLLLGRPSFEKKPKVLSLQIGSGWNLEELLFKYIHIDWHLWRHTFKMAAMASFHAEKCCHLANAQQQRPLVADLIEICIKNPEEACAENICVTEQHGAVSGTYLFIAVWNVRYRRITRRVFYFNDPTLQVLKYMRITNYQQSTTKCARQEVKNARRWHWHRSATLPQHWMSFLGFILYISMADL